MHVVIYEKKLQTPHYAAMIAARLRQLGVTKGRLYFEHVARLHENALYVYVTWASLQLKSPTIRLFILQSVETKINEKQSSVSLHL